MQYILSFSHVLKFTVFCTLCAFQQDSQLSLPHNLQGQIPWDLQALAQPPEYEWIDKEDSVWAMLYTGEKFQGKPTQVFAYYADPSTLDSTKISSSSYPGIILVHGGGGTAFRVWAKEWAARGYAALAMDLRGSKPLPESEQNHVWGTKSIRLTHGGPTENHQTQFYNIDESFEEQWQFHAVSNIISAHSLLRSFDWVDQELTVITGISWGGYLTCLVAGIDHRFKAAVPVYGSGFLDEGSYWTTHQILDSLGSERKQKWIKLWDPSLYISNAEVPMLFINGTNDFAYYAEAWDRSAGLAKKGYQLLKIGMKHSHKDGAEPKEIEAFFEQVLYDEQKLPILKDIQSDHNVVKASLTPNTEVEEVSLVYTTEDTLNTERHWFSVPAQINQNSVEATVPKGAKVFYLTIKNRDGLSLSSTLFFE